jgi:nicotinamidase-related amidase
MPSFDPRKTALVLIDLQKGIVGRPLLPHSGDAVVAAGQALAARFRAAGAAVVLVNVAWSADGGDMPPQDVDERMALPPGGLPAEWSELVPGLVQPGDILVTKRQWGAFHGTDLDLQLRRRGIDTIVLAGVATNFGVESTARFAWELGYRLAIVEDASSSSTAELHEFAIRRVLPRIAHVVAARDVELAVV